DLAPLTRFVLPGGTPLAAALHHARTVCRRAERRVTALAASESVAPTLVRWLNRLADLLFVMARWANHRARVPDRLWEPRGKAGWGGGGQGGAPRPGGGWEPPPPQDVVEAWIGAQGIESGIDLEEQQLLRSLDDGSVERRERGIPFPERPEHDGPAIRCEVVL